MSGADSDVDQPAGFCLFVSGLRKCREVRQKKGGQATPDTSRENISSHRRAHTDGSPRALKVWDPAVRTFVLTVSCQQASEGNGVLYFSFAVESGSGSRWDPAVRTFVLTVSCQQASEGNGVLYFSFAAELGSGSRWDPAVRTFVLTVSCQQASGGKVCFTFRLPLSRVLKVVGVPRLPIVPQDRCRPVSEKPKDEARRTSSSAFPGR